MKTVKVQLRLPENLRDAAAHQAAQRGVSLNLFLATAVAARVGAKAEAQRHLTARGSRTTPQRARKSPSMSVRLPGRPCAHM